MSSAHVSVNFKRDFDILLRSGLLIKILLAFLINCPARASPPWRPISHTRVNPKSLLGLLLSYVIFSSLTQYAGKIAAIAGRGTRALSPSLRAGSGRNSWRTGPSCPGIPTSTPRPLTTSLASSATQLRCCVKSRTCRIERWVRK